MEKQTKRVFMVGQLLRGSDWWTICRELPEGEQITTQDGTVLTKWWYGRER